MKRSSRTKAKIFEAAQRQFAHYGFAKVTMDEIANEIGMGKASLYYYFPTKENLFIEVISREHDEFIKSVSLMIEEKIPAGSKLTRFAEERVQHFTRLLSLNIVEARQTDHIRPMVKQTFRNLAQKELSIIKKILREGKAKGEFTIRSVDAVATTILHVMQGLRQVFLRGAQQHTIEAHDVQMFKKEFLLAIHILLTGMTCRLREN